MLIAEQRSALSGFTYDLKLADGTVIGELCFPDWAEARNARLKNPAPKHLSSRIDMTLSGAAYSIEFEYTRRGWENDTRYELMKDGVCVAAADVTVPKSWFRLRTLTITEPFSGELVRRSSLLKTRYELRRGDQTLGLVHEPEALATKRRLCAELPPDIRQEVQAFLLFLVINQAFS